ncbi:hypothetical protein AAZX31_04G217700 [Glycine max]
MVFTVSLGMYFSPITIFWVGFNCGPVEARDCGGPLACWSLKIWHRIMSPRPIVGSGTNQYS